VFENIIAQAASIQLKADILSRRLAPSMLFFGPAAAGKGSAAIELARVLSCENEEAPWKCDCSACARHRALVHPDLVILGPKGFAAEIAASRAAFLRDPAAAAGRSLFIRSLRKLLARFAPAVWEYESKSGRGSPLTLLQSLEEEIDEFETLASSYASSDSVETSAEVSALDKLTGSLLKDAFKLEDEYMSETIPIAQIRRAAYWSRLSPSGKRKTLIIENADRMKDEARNSLLKLLEEPPESLNIVLTVLRRESLLETILSRLRPYRFLARGANEEREIIRRVFRDTRVAPEEEDNAASALVAAYLDSFLPQPPEKLLPLAAFFVAAVARAAAVAAKSRGFTQGDGISPTLKALGSYCAPIAESAGFERSGGAQEVIAALLSRSGNFEGRSFPRFLALALDLVSWSMNQYIAGPPRIVCGDIWRRRLGEAQAAYGVWNQRPELALESLFHNLKEDMARG